MQFNVYEVGHDDAADESVRDLRNAGCTNIRIVQVEYSHERMTVECDLPAGVAFPQDLELFYACV